MAKCLPNDPVMYVLYSRLQNFEVQLFVTLFLMHNTSHASDKNMESNVNPKEKIGLWVVLNLL